MLATSIAPLGSIVIARAAPIDSFFVLRNRFQNSGIGSIAFQGNCAAHGCKTGKIGESGRPIGLKEATEPTVSI